MIQELVYTSLENGLLPGTRGFTTAAMTEGMSMQTRQLLESLSGYTHLYSNHDASYEKNPVAWSHLISQQSESILSRVAACAFDYTGRTNKLAHHLLLVDEKTLLPCGPASILRCKNALLTEWSFNPMLFEKGRLQTTMFQSLREPSPRANAWGQTRVGEKGAAALAQFFKNAVKNKQTNTLPAYVVFDPETKVDLLLLVEEACALLTPIERWEITFCTYFTTLPIGMRCDWRFCVKDEPTFMRQRDRTLWIDLTEGKVHNDNFDYTNLLDVAKTGMWPVTVIQGKQASKTLIDIGAENSEGIKKLPLRKFNLKNPPQEQVTQPRTIDFNKGLHRNKNQPANSTKEFMAIVLVIIIGCIALYSIWTLNKHNRDIFSETPRDSQTTDTVKDISATDSLDNKPLASEQQPSAVIDETLAIGSSTNRPPINPRQSDALTSGSPLKQKGDNHEADSISNTERSAENEANNNVTTSKPSNPKADDPEQVAPSSSPARSSENYEYHWLDKLSGETVPENVKDAAESDKNEWKYYGLLSNNTLQFHDGKYRPGGYVGSKGVEETSFFSKDETSQLFREYKFHNYKLILFENSSTGKRYLHVPESTKDANTSLITIQKVQIKYPCMEIPVPEFKDFPQALLDTIRDLNCLKIKLSINPGSGWKPLGECKIANLSKPGIKVDYKEQFLTVIEQKHTKNDFHAVKYVGVMTEIKGIMTKTKDLNQKQTNKTQELKGYEEEKNKLTEKKQMEEKIKKFNKKKQMEEKIKKCNKEIKEYNEEIKEVKKKIEKKGIEKLEALEEMEGVIPIEVSIIFEIPPQSGGSQ